MSTSTYFKEVLIAFLPFVALAAALYWIGKVTGYPESTERMTREPAFTPRDSLFTPIRQTDPAFTWEAFRSRAIAAYMVVQRARMVRQPATARDWVTPQLLVGLSNSIQFIESGGVARTLAPIDVTRMEPIAVVSKGDHFLLDVRIIGQTSRDAHNVIMGLGPEPVPVRATEGLVHIDEIWTFRRKIGAQTSPDVSRIHCTNCGAPIRRLDTEDCEYCGRSLNRIFDEWRVAMFAPTQFMQGPDGHVALPEGEGL